MQDPFVRQTPGACLLQPLRRPWGKPHHRSSAWLSWPDCSHPAVFGLMLAWVCKGSQGRDSLRLAPRTGGCSLAALVHTGGRKTRGPCAALRDANTADDSGAPCTTVPWAKPVARRHGFPAPRVCGARLNPPRSPCVHSNNGHTLTWRLFPHAVPCCPRVRWTPLT